MTYESKYNELMRLDNSGLAQRLYDILVALSFLQNNTRSVKADDYSLACLMTSTPAVVQKLKKILYENGYINYNTEDKIEIINENDIVADLNSIEIIKD